MSDYVNIILRKLTITICFLLLPLPILSQQFSPYNTFNLQDELQKFVEQGGRTEEISHNIYQLTYPAGEKRIFNFNKKLSETQNQGAVDTTIINMWEIDTTEYCNKFIFWQRVGVNNYFTPPFVDDLNRNGLPEIYGRHHSDLYNWGPVEIYERNESGVFEPLYTYPDSGTWDVQAMGEIHGSGEKEIWMDHQDSLTGSGNIYGVVYRSDSTGVLPTALDFTFYYIPIGQLNYITFGDFDKNGITDAAFIADFSKIVISTYDSNLNNFATVFDTLLVDDAISGFIVGDFDMDGHTDLIVGTGNSFLYSIESSKENLYEIVWQSNLSVYNAYMVAATDDIDGNGKPEFWIGGQDFPDGITRFQCFEAKGDNDYRTVAVIELRYINGLHTAYLQAKDMDGDGKPELIITIENVILILKFTGSPDNHKYEIIYAKLGEQTQPGIWFEPIALSDLDGDGKTDILIPFIGWYPGGWEADNFSYIIRQNDQVSIDASNLPAVSYSDQISSYPVPFNSTSSIRFKISKRNSVKISIYNGIGKEINIIFDKELSPGEYNIQWDAKDKYGSPLPSGVYFICLQTGNVIKTTKTILLK